MFAVVEFESRECALVPLVWLTEGNTKCYWPNTIRTQNQLDKLVHLSALPKMTWKMFPIIRVLYSSQNYVDCEKRLQEYLNDETSSDDTTTNKTTLTLKCITETVNEESTESKCKKPNIDVISNVAWNSPNFLPIPAAEKIATAHYIEECNNQNFVQLQTCRTATPDTFSLISSINNNNNDNALVQLEPGKIRTLASPHHPSISSGQDNQHSTTESSSTVTNESLPPYMEILFKNLEYIKKVVDQHAIMLDEILRTLGSKGAAITQTPDNLPNLPIKTRQDLQRLEAALASQNSYNYLVRRTAAIGGPNVRVVTMNILKFLLSDEIASQFNWSGREEKQAFKSTILSGLIVAAVKLAFAGREPSDLQDSTIKSAIQDWLKLAPQRYRYNVKKRIV